MTSALATSSLLAAQAYGGGQAVARKPQPAPPTPEIRPDAGTPRTRTNRPDPVGARDGAVRLDLSPDALARLSTGRTGLPFSDANRDASGTAGDRGETLPRLAGPSAHSPVVMEDPEDPVEIRATLPAARREAPFALRDLDRPEPSPPGSAIDLSI